MNEIRKKWIIYIELSMKTVGKCGQEELGRRIDRQKEQMDQVEKSVEDIRTGNAETFEKIREVFETRTYENSASFRPDLSIRPPPLVSNSSLSDVNNFISQFNKYTQSGNNFTIPGIIYAQAQVNMDAWWLT